MAEELPDYLKKVEKRLLRKIGKRRRKPKPAAKIAAPVPVNLPSQQTTARPRPQKKSLTERWQELSEGPFGTVVYIVLGFLIALAVNEGLKPILATDTPVVAVFSESMLPTLEKGDLVVVRGGEEIKLGDIVIYDAPTYKYPI